MTTITLDQAKAKFGTLIEPKTKTYSHFETPEGDWRPTFDDRMKVVNYKLYPKLRTTTAPAKYRPRP